MQNEPTETRVEAAVRQGPADWIRSGAKLLGALADRGKCLFTRIASRPHQAEKATPSDDEPSQTVLVHRMLAAPQAGSEPHGQRRIVLASSVGAALFAGWLMLPGGTAEREFKTAPVERRDLSVKITTSGTLQPTNVIKISSEISGMMRKVHVDVNDRVKKGQVLAELDRSQLEGQYKRAKHTRDAAQARLTGVQSKSELRKRNWDRSSWYSAIQVSKAELAAAQEELKLAAGLLARAMITSPIDGVVLKRTADPGQTVAASFQAPTLFVLAEDLRKMQLLVDIDEADVVRVARGHKAKFRVQALRDKTFKATVASVHLSGQDNQGVVTYKAMLDVDNADLVLRPDMTAVAAIRIPSSQNALVVPNRALRFKMPDVATADAAGPTLLATLGLSAPGLSDVKKGRIRKSSRNRDSGKRQIWVLRHGKATALTVTIGASDGKRTEITEGELLEGELVITGIAGER